MAQFNFSACPGPADFSVILWALCKWLGFSLLAEAAPRSAKSPLVPFLEAEIPLKDFRPDHAHRRRDLLGCRKRARLLPKPGLSAEGEGT